MRVLEGRRPGAGLHQRDVYRIEPELHPPARGTGCRRTEYHDRRRLAAEQLRARRDEPPGAHRHRRQDERRRAGEDRDAIGEALEHPRDVKDVARRFLHGDDWRRIADGRERVGIHVDPGAPRRVVRDDRKRHGLRDRLVAPDDLLPRAFQDIGLRLQQDRVGAGLRGHGRIGNRVARRDRARPHDHRHAAGGALHRRAAQTAALVPGQRPGLAVVARDAQTIDAVGEMPVEQRLEGIDAEIPVRGERGHDRRDVPVNRERHSTSSTPPRRGRP